ncbi:hypothetical protein [Mesorhizobium amorphae]|uniref:hypothetical protein n=1 Tax=Mesorhizobium amorphae TaxID=71433 RepID=UPI001780BD3F|nr:hypothetical protein [Mesorhizobium amorphae]
MIVTGAISLGVACGWLTSLLAHSAVHWVRPANFLFVLTGCLCLLMPDAALELTGGALGGVYTAMLFRWAVAKRV